MGVCEGDREGVNVGLWDGTGVGMHVGLRVSLPFGREGRRVGE